MRLFIILAILSLHLFSSQVETVYNLYQKKSYKKACDIGLHIFNKNKKNKKFLMLYAFSCLHADYIDRLAIPMIALRGSKSQRANASYLATILLQKKLLYNALIDHVDISNLRLPKTDYVLSKVFDLYTKKKYKKINDKFYFKVPKNSALIYVLYIQKKAKMDKMIVEERFDGQLIKKHIYW